MRQIITKNFNTRLRGESFTRNRLQINRLQAKGEEVKAEKRKLAERALRARGGRRGRRSPSPQPLAKSCPLSPPTPPLLRESRLLFTDSKNNRSFSTARTIKSAKMPSVLESKKK